MISKYQSTRREQAQATQHNKQAFHNVASITKIAAEEVAMFVGGPMGTRTPDPLLAKQVLYQLSYWPLVKEGERTAK